MGKSITTEANEQLQGKVNDRIEDRAERIKHATTEAVTHTKEAVDRAADHVESGLHQATDKAAGAANRASEKAAKVSERGQEVYNQAKECANDWLDQACHYVRQKPVQSIAIAVGTGWLLGRLLRR